MGDSEADASRYGKLDQEGDHDMTLDLSKIPNVAARRRLAELEAEGERIGEESYRAVRPVEDERDAAVDVLREKYQAERATMVGPFGARIAAILAPFYERKAEIDAELDRLVEEIGCGDRVFDEGFETALTCDLTGLPVFELDPIIKDEEEGDVILRDALPWPETAAATDDDNDEAAYDFAAAEGGAA